MKTNCFKVIGIYERDIDKKMEKTVYIRLCYIFYGDENLKDKSNNRFIYMSEVTIKILSNSNRAGTENVHKSVYNPSTYASSRALFKQSYFQ